MISGIAAYGGTSGVPVVGQRYYTSFLVGIPGNPCGPGSASVATTLVLPPHTTIDTSAPIRCFGQPNNGTFGELTGGTWSFLGQSGPYCPTAASPSALHQGGLFLGFRPLASGTLFQIFVPVISTAPLVGIGASPADGFRWLTDATGVYANPGLSTVWANVFASSTGSDPFVYFARPAATPFWKADAPSSPTDQRNRVELFANVYTAGLGGTLCYEVRRISDNSLRATCAIDLGYSGTVPPGNPLVQVLPGAGVQGPNGGYAPFFLDGPLTVDPEWGQDMKIVWTFTPTAGAPVSAQALFHTLPGPDGDGDGVADATDACPTVKGTLPDGCLPAVQPDPDADGVYGAADLCPAADGQGALNGCPGGAVPAPVIVSGTPPGPVVPGPVAKLGGRLVLARNTKLARTGLLKGRSLKVTCTRDATVRAVLTIARKTARQLHIRARTTTLSIASGAGACKAAGGGSLKLKIGAGYRRALRRAKRAFPAVLAVTFAAAGIRTAPLKTPVRVG